MFYQQRTYISSIPNVHFRYKEHNSPEETNPNIVSPRHLKTLEPYIHNEPDSTKQKGLIQRIEKLLSD